MAFTEVLERDWTVVVLVKNIAEFESLMWTELMGILGYDTNRTPPPIRRSWPTDGGPDWKISDDVIFMQVTEQPEEIMQPVDTLIKEYSQNIVCPAPAEFQFTSQFPVYFIPAPPPFFRTELYSGMRPEEMREDTGRLLVRYTATTRTMQLRLNAYGPACYESLMKIRFDLLHGRFNLRTNKIYIVPGKDAIQYAPELFQGRWWKRADLTLTFNALMIVDTTINIIEEVNVTVKVNEPGTSTKIVEPGEIIIKKG